MTFKVTTTSTSYNVKLTSPTKLKVNQAEAIVANNFADLNDVNVGNLNPNKDNYVVVYDSDTGQFTLVDPDVVLSAASTTSGPQPGLPADFVNTLDVDLDDRIDLDAGTF